jgi:O-acetyl-ADP-ribose deacetylase
VDEWIVSPGRTLALVIGDITRIPADAIVNAANDALVGGGGVDGAIHRAAGPGIMEDLRRRYGANRRCPTGSAVVSIAGLLPARWVIHAVGPVWRGGESGEAALLASAYLTSLRLADELGARHVTFPAISTGVYGYPLDEAADVTINALTRGLARARSVERATVVAFSRDALEAFETALERSRQAG